MNKTLRNYKGYLGNQQLKRAGVQVEWTPDSMAEFLKCAEDPVYFAENYMYIIDADGDKHVIELYEYQKEIIRSLHDERRVIVLQARQSGKTTAVTAFILWYVIFNQNKNVALLANKGDVAREILKRIQLAYELLPKWIQQGVVEWNKGSVEFENGCRILAGATSKDSIRGYTIHFMFIDECAFVENWEDFFISTFNTMANSRKSKIAMVSTPKGLNHYHDFWKGAIAEKGTKDHNGYKAIKVTWREVPGRDENWKMELLRGTNFNYELFEQEHEVEFLGSSGTLIAGWKLQQLTREIPLNYKLHLAQYEKPTGNHIYMITADVCQGKGLDYSTLQVIDVTEIPYKQVASFRDNMISPKEFAEILFNTGKMYNGAPIMIELNDMGAVVAEQLFELEYEHIIYTIPAGRAGKKAVAGYAAPHNADKGLRTTKSTKAVGCQILKLLVEGDKLLIRDEHTINELKTFSRVKDTWAAEEGKHDDLVMGLVLFGWLTDQQYFKELTDINTLQILREKSEEQIMEEMLPFGFIDDGIPDEEDGFKTVSISEFDRWLTS